MYKSEPYQGLFYIQNSILTSYINDGSNKSSFPLFSDNKGTLNYKNSKINRPL